MIGLQMQITATVCAKLRLVSLLFHAACFEVEFHEPDEMICEFRLLLWRRREL